MKTAPCERHLLATARGLLVSELEHAPSSTLRPLHSLLQLRLSGAAEAYYHRLLAARSKPIETLRLLRALQTRPGDGARGARGSPRGVTSRGLYCGTQDAGFEELSPRDGMLRSHTT